MNIRISLQVDNRTYWAIDKSAQSVTDLYSLVVDTISRLRTITYSSLLKFSRSS